MTTAKDCVLTGALDQVKAGDDPRPSQVYSTPMAPPSEPASLVRVKADGVGEGLGVLDPEPPPPQALIRTLVASMAQDA
jgi:hypothetical protein